MGFHLLKKSEISDFVEQTLDRRSLGGTEIKLTLHLTCYSVSQLQQHK